MNVFIIIPVFNRKEFTRDCLNSLREQTHSEFSTIVVDDGSTDGTDRMLAEEFPEAIVLEGDGNLWWTGGVNMGIEYALEQGATHCMTLNNDTIAPSDFMEKTRRVIQAHPLAVFGALERDVETKEITYGGRIPGEIRKVDWLSVLSESERSGLKEVHWLPGRGLVIPAKVFEKIGLFDVENFPHYYADFDFTYNARLAGFKVYINYDADLFTYPEESGEKLIKAKGKSLKGYYDHLYSIRGGANLKNFTKFQVKNSPRLLLPFRIVEGYAKRVIGYWIN